MEHAASLPPGVPASQPACPPTHLPQQRCGRQPAEGVAAVGLVPGLPAQPALVRLAVHAGRAGERSEGHGHGAEKACRQRVGRQCLPKQAPTWQRAMKPAMPQAAASACLSSPSISQAARAQ